MAPFCFGRESFDQYGLLCRWKSANSTETQTLGFTGFGGAATFGVLGWVDGTQNTTNTTFCWCSEFAYGKGARTTAQIKRYALYVKRGRGWFRFVFAI
jgi:hypothetical protein